MPPPADSAGPAAASLTPIQRTAAYGLIRDREGRVLLVHASARSDLFGHWLLPGGGLRHGESPADGVRREVFEETGLKVPASAVRPLHASGDVIDLPHRGVSLHTVRLIFAVSLPAADQTAALRSEPDGTSDQVQFVSLDDAAELPLMPFVADQLGLGPAPGGGARPVMVSAPERPEPLMDDTPVPPGPGSHPVAAISAISGISAMSADAQPSTGPDEGDTPAQPQPDEAAEDVIKVQRPAAYAVLVSGNPSGSGRILLSKLTGADLWTLPGGGIDHGEAPLAALTREVHEEAGLPYTPGELLDISSRHFTGRAPSGRLEDFHGIRLIYGGSVPDEPSPQVIDVGGSSDDAAWFRVRELSQVNTVATVRHGLRLLRHSYRNGTLR